MATTKRVSTNATQKQLLSVTLLYNFRILIVNDGDVYKIDGTLLLYLNISRRIFIPSLRIMTCFC